MAIEQSFLDFESVKPKTEIVELTLHKRWQLNKVSWILSPLNQKLYHVLQMRILYAPWQLSSDHDTQLLPVSQQNTLHYPMLPIKTGKCSWQMLSSTAMVSFCPLISYSSLALRSELYQVGLHQNGAPAIILSYYNLHLY